MNKKKKVIIAGSVVGIIVLSIVIFFVVSKVFSKPKADELLKQYMGYIEERNYDNMYEMLSTESKEAITKDDFVARNKNIYEGIEGNNITIDVSDINTEDKSKGIVSYKTTMDTIAGNISFDNKATFSKDNNGNYTLVWSDNVIYPDLTSKDKVRVTTDSAKRGDILDRNGKILAGKGTASSVGLVPGKMNSNNSDISKLADLLGVSKDSIESKLKASWVKSDSFVPIKTIKKVDYISSTSSQLLESQQQKEKLLQIPGVLINDVTVRYYPLEEKASHLTGYVQNVTAEDLESHKDEGYTSNSLIGKSGMEALYEKELKGQDGHKISIINEKGMEKTQIAAIDKTDGENIKLTIDSDLQVKLYDEFQSDKSCSVAMNPSTGEVLALVSTPTFNSNDFILGLSDEKWNSLNNDPAKPLNNRFRQSFAPGSTFKPIIAGIGLETGAINATEDIGTSGTSWQKDSSWGDFKVTTLHTYSPVNLENALIYSDNIYFAKAALKIGSDKLVANLKKLGFNEEMPFEISMTNSQYSNNDSISSEIQLADSGYGQGEVLVNPLHLASLYTAFVNDGNVIKPYLKYTETPESSVWIEGAFSSNNANTIKTDLEKVVSNPEGTGYAAHMNNLTLAGKTGTAEIKGSQKDTTGTELGWFTSFTTDKNCKKPILLLTMVEDVKDRGGSAYVVTKDKNVLDKYFN